MEVYWATWKNKAMTAILYAADVLLIDMSTINAIQDIQRGVGKAIERPKKHSEWSSGAGTRVEASPSESPLAEDQLLPFLKSDNKALSSATWRVRGFWIHQQFWLF